MEITLTVEERKRGQLSEKHRTRAVDAVLNDGFVVLANAVDPAHLDLLRERMAADSATLVAAERWGGAGRVMGHLQQGAPPFAPYVFGDVVANSFAIQVSSAILGEGAYNSFYNGNANSPGSGTQPLHRDGRPLWLDLPLAHPPCSVVVNVALVDVTEENGSTELWPGTHLETSVSTYVATEIEAERRELVPPVRANTRKGSLLLRDIRLWHRGMPNRSDTVRHMLAMIHNASWLQRPEPLLFNTGCEEAFAGSGFDHNGFDHSGFGHSGFDHNVAFTDEPLEYLLTRTPTPVSASGSA